jgi:hypothetical protein
MAALAAAVVAAGERTGGLVDGTLAPEIVAAGYRAAPALPPPLPLTLSGPGAADGWLRYGGVVVLDDGTHRVVEAR